VVFDEAQRAWERLELSQFSRGPKDEISRTDVKKPERRQ
jgi:hypothetical protein